MKNKLIILGWVLGIGLVIDLIVCNTYTLSPNSFIINTLFEALIASSSVGVLFSRRIY